METTMYDMLLQLPLFQGLGKNEFTDILSKVKFHFRKYKAGEKIISAGDSCKNLVFLLSGCITAETEHEEDKYVFGETLDAPALIEPYCLFGLKQHFISSYIAKTNVSIITIEKEFFATELNNYDIFRINYINLLSNHIQQLRNRVIKVPHGSCVEDRITEFLFMLSERPYGEKQLRVKMEDLAQLLGCTRIKISQALNNMQKKELITLQRMGFKVPAVEKLRSDNQNG